MCAILVYETKTSSAFKFYETYTNSQKQILTFKKCSLELPLVRWKVKWIGSTRILKFLPIFSTEKYI